MTKEGVTSTLLEESGGEEGCYNSLLLIKISSSKFNHVIEKSNEEQSSPWNLTKSIFILRFLSVHIGITISLYSFQL